MRSVERLRVVPALRRSRPTKKPVVMDDRPVVARVADAGHSLVIFIPGGKRVALDPGQVLQDSAIEDLLAAATPLTPTECLVSATGSQWLVQASGPVWAEAAATDACGLVFTALDGSMKRIAVTGLPPGPLPTGEQLADVLVRALAAPGETEGGGDGRK